MAESEIAACNCTYINIMQLFHELKQRFPKVPDQIVTKIIKQNFHDKAACETLLERESSIYMQCYPGALISGDGRPASLGPISDHCPTAGRRSSQTACCRPNHEDASALPTQQQQQTDVNACGPIPHGCPSHAAIDNDDDDDSTGPASSQPSLERKLELAHIPLGQLVREAREKVTKRENKQGCDVKCTDGCDKTSSRSSSADTDDPPPPQRPTTLPCDILPVSVERLTLESPASSCSSPSSASAEPKLPPASPRKSKSPRGTPPVSSPNCRTPVSPNRSTPPSAFPSRSPQSQFPTSPNRLAPPSFGNPFVACSYPPPRLPTHENSSGLPNLDSSQPAPPTSEPTKDFEFAVECYVQPSPPGDQQRSFTSVNLTLRPPSAETTLPINISSGQSLTYTSASFDPRQGYQSHLQIRIGPALLQQQRERKELLARRLEQNKERLRHMQVRAQAMKMALARTSSVQYNLSKLKADISMLRGECERLAAAVDAYSTENQPASNLPLGGGWSCGLCTFRNHPLLGVCEACEMPRFAIGTESGTSHPASASVMSNPAFPNNNNPSCSAGETSTSVSRTITPLQER